MATLSFLSIPSVRRGLGIMAGLLALGAGPALADAPTAVSSGTHGTATVNADGSRTATVQGTWQWTSQTSDCNTTRAGAGYALDWNDPGQPGSAVGTVSGTSIAAGSAAVNALNPASDLVFPTSAPTPTAVSTNPLQWRSGCGVFATPPGYNTGSWGPASHTYASSYAGPITVCPVLYDVHGSAAGAPSGSSEIVAGGSGHNGDNSVQDNGSNNNCLWATLKVQPTLSVTAPTTATVGSATHATASLGSGFQPGASISFALYGPNDSTCKGTPVATGQTAVNGDGGYGSPSYVPQSAGTYHWQASYAGDANNYSTASSACSAAATTVSTATSAANTILPPLAKAIASGAPVSSLGTVVPAPTPVIGKTASVNLTEGTVLVRRPGGNGFETLAPGTSVPLGAVIDATHGAVLLGTAVNAAGTAQHAAVGGGEFVLRQSSSVGRTTIVPTGGSYSASCGRTPRHARMSGVAFAARSRKPAKRRDYRQLWSADHNGSYSTQGANSVATVRGTVWVTAEGCDGTRTSVIEGTVVVTDVHTGRRVVVGAGHSYLVRHSS